ncbi:N-methyl-D-aspartate receptor NMDAR2C subunit [Roseateles sp.]|uniref:HD domain-containing protein n=1 Tax=Roseateles sp. TaxID=1971397 RepID=UPI003947EFFE
MERLLARYAEPHRRYHSQQHLHECLVHLRPALHLTEHPGEVEIALWFHDAIYELKAQDNEAQSAQWAARALAAAGLSSDVCERVVALVMATRHAASPTAPDAQLLVDADLAILGATPERFAEYERQIREEYAWVPGWIFRRKRRAVLRQFLEREPLYATAHFRERLESAARRNLAQAIR